MNNLGGEDSADEQTPLDMLEDQYEEEVIMWLRKERAREVQEQTRNFINSPFNDDYRCVNASSYGGFQLLDDAITAKLRSVGVQIMSKAVSDVWKGCFSMKSLSFPIKATSGMSEL